MAKKRANSTPYDKIDQFSLQKLGGQWYRLEHELYQNHQIGDGRPFVKDTCTDLCLACYQEDCYLDNRRPENLVYCPIKIFYEYEIEIDHLTELCEQINEDSDDPSKILILLKEHNIEQGKSLKIPKHQRKRSK